LSADTAQQDPYQSLASIYDYVMRHVDYDNWAAYIRDIFTRFEHTPQTLIDLACGTGNVSMELCALGLPVVAGADASEAMLRVAREKAILGDRQIDFQQRDLRQLDQLGPFDAAVCMYDSFNYLLTLDDVRQALDQVYSILHPGALFVFDVCTEQNSLRYFRDSRDREIGPGFSFARHSYYEAEEQLQMNHFTIRFEGQDEPLEEHHVQHIYPVADLLDLLESTPFDLLGAFDGFTFKRGTERSDRIHFALRRAPI
jgi:ubiquinone/menaquinone biosynthesis C-methylase UbiE